MDELLISIAIPNEHRQQFVDELESLTEALGGDCWGYRLVTDYDVEITMTPKTEKDDIKV